MSYLGRHIQDFSERMLERWSWSAQHLIFVFRYYIKRRAFGSAHLFSHTIFKDAADAADLDPEAREYYALMIDRLRGKCYPRFQTRCYRLLMRHADRFQLSLVKVEKRTADRQGLDTYRYGWAYVWYFVWIGFGNAVIQR